jgi:hypothetical protein
VCMPPEGPWLSSFECHKDQLVLLRQITTATGTMLELTEHLFPQRLPNFKVNIEKYIAL